MWAWLRRLRVGAEAPAQRKGRYMPTEVAFIAKMYESGVSVDEISRRFNRSPQSISSKMQRCGIRRPPEYISQVRRIARSGG